MLPHEEAGHMNAFRTATNFAESPLTFAGRPHMGQRSLRRVDKAGHMIAIDSLVSLLTFLLHPGGRPHMHQRAAERQNVLKHKDEVAKLMRSVPGYRLQHLLVHIFSRPGASTDSVRRQYAGACRKATV
jgi:hypothetical protein